MVEEVTLLMVKTGVGVEVRDPDLLRVKDHDLGTAKDGGTITPPKVRVRIFNFFFSPSSLHFVPTHFQSISFLSPLFSAY